jgi:exodeoxyribonuclease-5
MEDGLRYAYNKYGVGNTIIVTRSNKAAVNYNLFIRRQIHFFEEEIEVGDIIMSVRNNYHYVPENSPSGFVANGDFLEVRKILGFEEMHGFRFADLELQYVDDGEMGEQFKAKVLMDTLYSQSTSLTEEENARLWQSVSQDYMDLESRKARKEAISKDVYLNAIQIKFAYALTCHKAQGGQWAAVFIDQGFVPQKEESDSRIKWLYTAFTRATEELYLINFGPDQFDD